LHIPLTLLRYKRLTKFPQKDIDNTKFEHLQNENDKEDAQAMGVATAEQSKGIDDSMAIDPNEEALREALEDDLMADRDEVVENANHDIDAESAEDLRKLNDEDFPNQDQEKHAGALIGKATQAQDSSEDSILKAQASLSAEEEEQPGDRDIAPEMDHLS